MSFVTVDKTNKNLIYDTSMFLMTWQIETRTYKMQVNMFIYQTIHCEKLKSY